MRIVALLRFPLLFPSGLLGREDLPLNDGWRFVQGDPAGLGGQAMSPAETNWIDADWKTVSLPHSWGWEEAQRGTNYYRGPGWYRRELKISPERGKRYFVRFEAASSVADVYLNGKLLGQHRGAFGAFSFELTRGLATNGVNLLAVRVSNAAEPDLAPLSGDFCVFGGLYRSAHLIETGDQNFAVTDHGSPGVAWLQTNVTEQRATINLVAQISNGARRNRDLRFVATVLD